MQERHALWVRTRDERSSCISGCVFKGTRKCRAHLFCTAKDKCWRQSRTYNVNGTESGEIREAASVLRVSA
jgi:hypothetical protein